MALPGFAPKQKADNFCLYFEETGNQSELAEVLHILFDTNISLIPIPAAAIARLLSRTVMRTGKARSLRNG